MPIIPQQVSLRSAALRRLRTKQVWRLWSRMFQTGPGLGPSQPKTQRESIARALGEVGQTRTWNLLIDVIAQTGHFKPSANSLQNDFIVEGEEHDWVHVAIDRFTGQVIDRQVEVVKE